MKLIVLLIPLAIFSCNQKNNVLSNEEKSQIKKEIMETYEKHAEALKNRSHKDVMKFYADVEDHVLFGDGHYWGDYKTIDEIWKAFDGKGRDLKNEFDKQNVYVFSDRAAMYFLEFYNERIEVNGDTTKVQGCFSYGMEKFPEGWKIIGSHVTHNYLEGYDPNK